MATAWRVNRITDAEFPSPLGEDTKRYQLADYAQLVRGSALLIGHIPSPSYD